MAVKTTKKAGQTIALGTATNKTVTNPYNEVYNTYKTNMNEAKKAQIGQLDTEYNTQKQQIEGNYGNLARNAYSTYMNANKANRTAQSNMGVNRSGMVENMGTQTATDYNRSIGNAGAYRLNQLSNAENNYNTQKANVETQYATDLAKARSEYQQANIARRAQLADLRSQQAFEARENAKNRRQQAKESARSYKQASREFKATRMENRFKVFQNTTAGYKSVGQINKTIKKLQKAKKKGSLSGWKKEYYAEIIYTLKSRRNVLRQAKKQK